MVKASGHAAPLRGAAAMTLAFAPGLPVKSSQARRKNRAAGTSPDRYISIAVAVAQNGREAAARIKNPEMEEPSFAQDLHAGLTRSGQKELPSKYLYDEVGSALFEVICVLPEILIANYAMPFYFGGTSLLIVVSVTMDTVAQIHSHLLAHQYEGLLKKSKLKGRRG